jgi:hypothetical protein
MPKLNIERKYMSIETIKLELTQDEADMVYDALRNHIDFVACDNTGNEQEILDSLFDKLLVASS